MSWKIRWFEGDEAAVQFGPEHAKKAIATIWDDAAGKVIANCALDAELADAEMRAVAEKQLEMRSIWKYGVCLDGVPPLREPDKELWRQVFGR